MCILLGDQIFLTFNRLKANINPLHERFNTGQKNPPWCAWLNGRLLFCDVLLNSLSVPHYAGCGAPKREPTCCAYIRAYAAQLSSKLILTGKVFDESYRRVTKRVIQKRCHEFLYDDIHLVCSKLNAVKTWQAHPFKTHSCTLIAPCYICSTIHCYRY